MKNIIKIICIALGAIIGAGFATGQEIYIFFGKYKLYGIIGTIISSSIISYILYIVLNYMKNYNIKSYSDYLGRIFKDNKFLCYLNENLINVFLLLTFYVMELGFVGLLWQQYGIPKYIGMITISALGYIILRGNAQSVVKTNVVVMPLLTITLLYIAFNGLKTFGVENVDLSVELNKMFLVNAIIYSSYNFIMLFPLIAGLNDRNITKKEIQIICVAVFIIIVVCSIAIIMLSSLFDVSNVEIPIIHMANFISSNTVILGVVLVSLAIFTSVVCVGYTFLNNISKNKKIYNRNLLIMCLISFLLVEFSFANTMQIVYTFLGVVGIIQILGILLANFRKN